MHSRGTPGVNPQEPSTSTGPQRRREDNLQNFNEIFSRPHKTTLWHVCTAHQRDPRAKMRYRLELQDLTAVDFRELLYDHRYELSILANASGTNFKELFDSLRFFARFRKVPFFKNPDALDFFKLVCNCIFHVETRWINGLNKENLLNPDSLRFVMQEMNMSDSMRTALKNSEFLLSPTNTGPTSNDVQPIPRLQDREKVPIPPPPTYRGTYDVAQDEYLREMHHYNFIRTYDDNFKLEFGKAEKRMQKYGGVECRKNAKNVTKKFPGYEDYDYFQDNVRLEASQLSFRLNTVAQIIDFKFPKIKADGYFPRDCSDRAQYVWDRYEEANRQSKECFQRIRALRPIKPGFKLGHLTQKECYEYHLEGRHIPGFFDVWEEEARGWKNPADGSWVSRRYLVDIYNQLMFPLHSERHSWPDSLRWAFDKYCYYGMKLWHMTKEYPTQLINAGDALFSPYSDSILSCINVDFTQSRGRSIYHKKIQAENIWVAEQFLEGLLEPKKEEEEQQVEVKPRRKRKGDPKLEEAEAMASVSPAKQQRTPMKIPEKAAFSSGPILPMGMMQVQKENLERPQVATAVPATPPQSSPYRHHQTPPSAVKRRMTESESEAKPVAIQPPQPKRKVSISLEKWNDRCVQGEVQEEHVDGREDDGYVWVPQDRGDRMEPEDYAREILAHYQGAAREERPATPPAPKTARRRKTVPKNTTATPERPAAPQPVMYSKPTPSTSSTVSAASAASVSAPNPPDNLSVPPGKTTAGKKRLQYSCKPNQPPSRFHLSNKYPVKQLPPAPQANGARYPSTAIATGTPSIGARISPYGGAQRTPYYPPQQMRRPQQPAHHPVMHQRFANGIHPTPTPSSSSSPSAQPPHRISLHPQGPAMYRISSVSPAVPGAATPNSSSQQDQQHANTPAQRAIANHPVPEQPCRRVLPYLVVMKHKHNHPWKPKNPENRSAAAAPVAPPPPPVAPPQTTPKPPLVVRRPASSGTQRVEYRQRSFSNAVGRPPNGVPPIAKPTMWPPPSPAAASAKDRSVGLNNTRHERPWVANNRASPMATTATAVMVNSRLPMTPGHQGGILHHQLHHHPMAPPTGPMPHHHQRLPMGTPGRPVTIAARVVSSMPPGMTAATLGTPNRMTIPPTPSASTPTAAPAGPGAAVGAGPVAGAPANPEQQEMSIKELSTAIRKNCKTLTPEQHGDALRTHSRRFQAEPPRGSPGPPPPAPPPQVPQLPQQPQQLPPQQPSPQQAPPQQAPPQQAPPQQPQQLPPPHLQQQAVNFMSDNRNN